MGRNARVLLCLVVGGIIGAVLTGRSLGYWGHPAALETPPALAVENVVPLHPQTYDLRRGDNLSDLLARAGIDQATSLEMTEAIREVFDVRKFRAGRELTVERNMSGVVESLEYIIDPDNKLKLWRPDGVYEAAVVEIPGTIRAVSVCGTLQGSLFESIERTGEKAELAIQMAEIFAWDIDFYRDPRPGDEFCMLVEKKEYDNGQPATYARMLSAEYINDGTRYDAFLFPEDDGKPVYYSYDGQSLQSAFLRSPLRFEARVSSHFSYRRLHPVLKVRRPHLGTDYAAPTGTAVRTIASGRVSFSGRSGGAGNLVKVQHSNGFETMYMHLSRRLVKKGQHVKQGQTIGKVGATGLATGPHLDFRIRKNGKYLNFERLRLPRSTKISAKQRQAFEAERDRLLAMLEAGRTRIAVGPMPEGRRVPADD